MQEIEDYFKKTKQLYQECLSEIKLLQEKHELKQTFEQDSEK